MQKILETGRQIYEGTEKICGKKKDEIILVHFKNLCKQGVFKKFMEMCIMQKLCMHCEHFLHQDKFML